MDAEILDLVVNIIKWGSLGLLILLVLILVVGGLIGMKRGVFNSAFRLLVTAVLATVALLTVRPIANAIANSNLGGLLSNFGLSSFQIGEGDEAVTIAITSLNETLANVLTALLANAGITFSGPQALEVISGLTYLVISTVVVILDGILILIFNGIVATILYHLIFKHIIPKKTRKRVRLKGVAFLTGSLKTLIVASMLIFPFSSLINNVVHSFRDEKNGVRIDNEMINTVETITDAYDSSILANVLFNWTSNDEGKTWDVALMDSLTSSDIGGLKVSLVDEIYNLVGIGKTLISAGILDDGGFDSLASTILGSEEIVVHLIKSIGSSGLVLVLIPVAVQLALNLEEAQEFVGDNLIDISDIDWKDEINNVHKMFQSVMRTGLLDDLFDENGSFVLDETFLMRVFDLDTYSGMMNLFKAFSNSKFLSRALSAVAYTMATSSELIDEFSFLLPSKWEDYSKIDWGEELSIVYETMFRINAIDSSMISNLVSFDDLGGDGDDDGLGAVHPDLLRALEYSSLGAPYQSEDDIMAKLNGDDDDDDATDLDFLEPLLANLDTFKQILIGRTDLSGNPLGVDEEGRTRVFDEEGQRILNRHYSLFDSRLLGHALSGTISFVIEMIFSELDLDTDAIDDLISDLNEGTPLLNYKKEFAALFDLLIVISEDEDVRGFIIDPENNSPIEMDDNGNIIDINLGLVETLKKALRQIDDSRLLSIILPTFFESLFLGDDMTDAFEGLGLDPSKLNFSTPRLGYELSLLLDAVVDIQELTSILASFEDVDGNLDDTLINDLLEDIASKDESLVHLLDTFYLSNIINEKDEHGQLIDGDDSNFFGVINFMFDTMLEGVGLTNKVSLNSIPKWANSRTFNGDFRRDANGEAIYDGENGYLILFIKAIGESRLLEIIDVADGVSIDFGALGGAVRTVFDAVEQSAVISATFGDVLDNFILSALSDDPGDVSFNNVTNWSVEGETFERLCLALDDFGGLDFTNIDFLGSDPHKVVELLSALADSQMFDGENGYLFGDFFYETLTSSLGGGLEFFYDPNATTTIELKKDFDSLDTRPLWQDEIARFGDVISALQGANVDENGDPIDTSANPDYLNLLTTGKVTPQNIGTILTSLNNTKIMRMVIYNGYAQIASAFESDQLNLKTMNNLALIEMGQAKRQIEIDLLVELYELINDLGKEDPNTGEYSYDFDLSDASTLNFIGNLETTLQHLIGSIVFNTLDDDALVSDETVFKQFVRLFVDIDLIKDNIYRVDNPKDVHALSLSLYNSNQTKVDYLINKNFPTPTLDLNYDLVFTTKTLVNQETYIEEIINVLDTLLTLDDSDGDPYAGGGSLDLGILNAVNFEKIFKSFNDSEVYYDLVPNLISKIVHEEAAYSIDDINIGAANPYFHYNGNEYENRFPEGEISELSDLFALLKDFTTLIPTGNVDLSLLNSNLVTFEDTLISLQETYTFHRAGSYLVNELTVFQQIMRKIYFDSYLGELAFEQVHDFKVEYQATTIEEAIYKNLTHHIETFENYSDPLYGPSLHFGNWSNEIYAFSNLISNLTNSSIDSTSLTAFDLANFTPNILGTILTSVNELDVVKDAAPHLIKNALYNEEISFSRFTTYNVAEFTFDASSFGGLLVEETLNDATYSVTLKGDNVISNGSVINFVANSTLYNTTPLTNIDSILIKTNDATKFTFYYGENVMPETKYYFAEQQTSGYLKIDLSEIPQQYFQIKALANFSVDDIIIKQAIEIGNYMQSQESYRDVNIPILVSLLDEVFDSVNNTYFDFSEPEGALAFVGGNRTLAPILAFIVNSDLYQEQIQPTYKAESLLFYNLFSFEMEQDVGGVTYLVDAALAKNVRGATLNDKLATIHNLINVDHNQKFDHLKEADALDYGLLALATFEGATEMPTNKLLFASPQDLYLYNIANFDNSPHPNVDYLAMALNSARRGQLDPDFISNGYGPALITSEIVAGQLNKILNNKYNYLDNEGIVYSAIDLYSNEYASLVDDLMPVTLSSAVNALYYAFNNIYAPNDSITSLDIQNAYQNLFNQDLGLIFYLADIELALNGDLLDGGRNLGVNPNPVTLQDFNDIANALIASRGL